MDEEENSFLVSAEKIETKLPARELNKLIAAYSNDPGLSVFLLLQGSPLTEAKKGL